MRQHYNLARLIDYATEADLIPDENTGTLTIRLHQAGQSIYI